MFVAGISHRNLDGSSPCQGQRLFRALLTQMTAEQHLQVPLAVHVGAELWRLPK